MNILIILGHPNPNSFNHAIAHTIYETLDKHNHHIIMHDLYAEAFNPLMSREEVVDDVIPDVIQTHCDELVSADGVIVVHPN